MRRPRGLRRGARRSALVLSLFAFLLVAPAGAANAEPLWWQVVTNPNSVCAPSDPVPEVAGTGLAGLIEPPGEQPPVTAYNNYEMAGLTWHATELGCSDYLAIVGNYAANFVFMIGKAIDRVTITAYQTAYSPGLLDNLSQAVTGLVTSLGQTFYLPYVTPVVLLGVVWLAWHGLVRKRATTSVEGVVWMIIAVTLALWFLNRPHDILRAGNAVVTGANCAITKGVAQIDPNVSATCFADGEEGPSAVAQTSHSLWMVLVYRPWLAGEFGQGAAAQGSQGASSVLARKYGGFGNGSLLWTQAITHRDLAKIHRNGRYDSGAASSLLNRKHDRWQSVRANVRENYPSVYPLFQGRQWGTRLGIAFAAFLAALFAGGLVLLVSVALIVLKLGFLLLMMTGPFFLLVGIHPGVGRVIALRWAELLVSTLLKQVVVALALAVLLFGYSVITTGSQLSWGLQILLLSLLGIAAFIYRKPFQHLFASVGGGFGGRVVGQTAGTNPELADAHRRLAASPAGPRAVRRLGGRLATTAFGGAVAGAVGGKVGAAAVATRKGDASTRPDSAGVPPNGAPAGTGAEGHPEEGADPDESAETLTGHQDRPPAGLRTGSRAGAPPPLGMAPRRSAGDTLAGQGVTTEPQQAPAGAEQAADTKPPPGAGTGAAAGLRAPRAPWGGDRVQRLAGAWPGGGRAGDGGTSSGEPPDGEPAPRSSWWDGPVRRQAPSPSRGTFSGSEGGEHASPRAPSPGESHPPGPSPASGQPTRGRARETGPQRGTPGRESHRDGPRLWAAARRPDDEPPLPFWLRPQGEDRDR